MSWQLWDQLRKQRAELRGKWTSREGTDALAKKHVSLHPERSIENPDLPEEKRKPHDTTRIRRDGQSLAVITHPHTTFNSGNRFQVNSFRPTVTAEHGPRKTVDDLGAFSSHDAAVEAILKSHGIGAPKISSATVLAERVSGPREHSIVSGPYEGKRAAPQKGMSETAKRADSIATTIRMNTGKRSADRIADKVDRPLSFDRVKKLYGGLLRVHRARDGEQGTIDQHMSGLAAMPQAHHLLVSRYLSEHPEGGIHIGNGRGIDMPGTKLSQLHAQGRSILGDRPNERADGVYSSDVRQAVVGRVEHSGSISTAAHEVGHALDDALGRQLSGRDVPASQLPHFQQVFSEVTHMHDNSKTLLNPYFTGGSRGTAESGAREMFAEGYAAWVQGRQNYRSPEEQALLIGHQLGAAPSEKLRVGRVIKNYFDIQDQKIRDAVTD